MTYAAAWKRKGLKDKDSKERTGVTFTTAKDSSKKHISTTIGKEKEKESVTVKKTAYKSSLKTEPEVTVGSKSGLESARSRDPSNVNYFGKIPNKKVLKNWKKAASASSASKTTGTTAAPKLRSLLDKDEEITVQSATKVKSHLSKSHTGSRH